MIDLVGRANLYMLMEMFIQAIGEMIRQMVLEFTFTLMVLGMKVPG
jgi:hypothetical protein